MFDLFKSAVTNFEDYLSEYSKRPNILGSTASRLKLWSCQISAELVYVTSEYLYYSCNGFVVSHKEGSNSI